MHLEQKASPASLPPWKQELLLRRSALARTVEPKLNEILNNDANEKFLIKAKDVTSESSLHNKLQRPLSVKSVNGTCSSRDGGVDGVATLSLSSSSKAGPLSPSPSSWPSGEPAAAGGRQRSCRMTTDKVVTPLQPSQRDHLDSFNALSTKRILVDPKAVRRQPSIDRNNMGEDTMSNKKCTGSGSGSGSGASFDSGSDSDSSEDLQYGPGFVSKLKSRYMSAAFKSSATSGLRRTASLEDFLDKDKEEVSIELNQPRMTKFQKKNNEDLRPSRRTGGVAAHVNKKSRESIKRCQSVEVLSRNRIEEPSSSSPPPLPPKNTQHHLDGVLNSEALANNNLVIERLPAPQSLKNVKSKTGFSSSSSTSSNSSPTVIASLRGPFHYRRRSALLFGINEVELPAPDTVKETRKIFETGNHRGLQTMVKSKSTSNLIYGQRRKSSSSPVRSSSKTTTRQNSQPKFHLVTAKPALPAKPDKVDLKKKTPTRPPMIKSLDRGGLQAKHSSKAEAIEIEEGIKIVSKDSINKIRSSGESFSFNFHKKEEKSSKPGYLPKAKAASENSDKVPVGVIKPITRNAKETSSLSQTVQQAPDATSLSSSISNMAKKQPEQKLQKTVPTVPPPPPTLSSTLSQPAAATLHKQQQRAESPTTTLNNLINLTKQTKNNETTLSEKENRKKEVVILPDKSILKSNNKSHKVVTFAQDLKKRSKVDNSASSTTDEGIDKDIAVAELESNIDVMKCNNNKVDNRDPSNESSWKTKTESKNTIVFNFLNSQKDVTHIENDGLDLSKRKKKQQLAKESGVVILRNSLNTSTQDEDEDEGVDEVDSDSDSGLGGSVPPCSVTFIGANVSTGKSSMRLSKPRDFKKRNITFSESLTQVFEYPSSDSSVTDQPSADTSTTSKLGITSSKNALGSFGGLGSYTPSKMKDANSFQLGVSRTVPHSTSTKSTLSSTTSEKTTTSSNGNEKPKEEVLRPIEDAISWSGSSSSSDMLF